ncbi:MAG: hypothetical protein KAT09_01015 [Candidatus Aegiribacteria sp.]|nr:hypothetical protein [Candidatus Aegiribacteria sp.]
MKRILIHAVALTVIGLLLTCCMSTTQMMTLGVPLEYAKSPVFDSKQLWRTVVLPPSASSIYSSPFTTGLYDYAGMALLRTGRFSLVDRTIVDQLLTEQEFSYSGVVDQATAVQLGKLLGAEAVMTINIGQITHDNFWDDEPAQRDVSLHVLIISVETSEVLYTSMGMGSDFEGAEGALRMAIEVALMGINE